MTPEMAALLKDITCRRCNGHGYLGGMSIIFTTVDGPVCRNDGFRCPECEGSGVRKPLEVVQ